jgi:serine/threonine protein kinase
MTRPCPSLEVYRARDSRLGRDVAVKVLPEHLAQNPAMLARFEREARAVAALWNCWRARPCGSAWNAGP